MAATGRANSSHAVNRLNPRIVIELSATPNRRISNLLVDISGVDLKKEAMIKLPVEVTSVGNAGWQRDAVAKPTTSWRIWTRKLARWMASEGRYIRPIAVVRVERTGKEQRSYDNIHAENVREYLTQQLGVRAGCGPP